MTSELDTAGLVVEQLRAYAGNSPDDYRNRAADLIEVLTQATASDMEGDGLPQPAWYSDGFQIKSVPFDHNGLVAVPLYSAAQLSAMQADLHLLRSARDNLERAWDEANSRAEAAEARVAELLAQINGGGNDASSS